MTEGASSRRKFAQAVTLGLGVVSIPSQAMARVVRQDVTLRKVAELPEGMGRVGKFGIELNETARFIYDQCDGTRTAATITDAVARQYDIDPQTARQDVIACLDQLQSMGLLEVRQSK